MTITPQFDMFDRPPTYPLFAGAKEKHGTSEQAAHEIEASGRAATLRGKVLTLFLDGHELTADECAERLGESVLAIRPRCSELFKAGSIEKTERRRVNAGGKGCRVFRRRAA